MASRFIVSYKSKTNVAICVAVSKSTTYFSRRAGDWMPYQLNLPQVDLAPYDVEMDYLKMGVWRLCDPLVERSYLTFSYTWADEDDPNNGWNNLQCVHAVSLLALYKGEPVLSVAKDTCLVGQYWNSLVPVTISSPDCAVPIGDVTLGPTFVRFNAKGYVDDGEGGTIEVYTLNPATPPTLPNWAEITVLDGLGVCKGDPEKFAVKQNCGSATRNLESLNCVLMWPVYGVVSDDVFYVDSGLTTLDLFPLPIPKSFISQYPHLCGVL